MHSGKVNALPIITVLSIISKENRLSSCSPIKSTIDICVGIRIGVQRVVISRCQKQACFCTAIWNLQSGPRVEGLCQSLLNLGFCLFRCTLLIIDSCYSVGGWQGGSLGPQQGGGEANFRVQAERRRAEEERLARERKETEEARILHAAEVRTLPRLPTLASKAY